jgi:hypothetical protein
MRKFDRGRRLLRGSTRHRRGERVRSWGPGAWKHIEALVALARRGVVHAIEWRDGHSIGLFVEQQFEPPDFAAVDDTDTWASFSF